MKYFFYSILFFTFFEFLKGNHIKGLDDSILFRLNWPGPTENLLGSPEYEKFEMISTNNEKFQCLVPINYGETNDYSDAYAGPNALQLLMPLFKKSSCTLRLEQYWTYELCHGLHIKQYHEEREGKNLRFQEYNLGTTNIEEIEMLTKELTDELLKKSNRDIPMAKIEGIDMPYFSIKYSHGTLCDLTGNPRISRVLYICHEEGRHTIYSIKETFTCEYEVIILTSLLCEHPSYRPQEVPQTNLHCIPMEEEGTKRPKNLLHNEAESLKFRTQGAVVGDVSGGSIRLEVVAKAEEVEIVNGFEETKEPVRRHPLFPPQPFIDRDLIQSFLLGDHCLSGGAGYWKYEFCYGKMAYQYHESAGDKIVISLGKFDLEAHIQWLKNHPSKEFKKGKNVVSHFYSGGDYCDVTGKPRQVEVKLTCKESINPSSVSLYLYEPKTCEYIIGIETSLVCPLMENADENGLFPLDDQMLEEMFQELEKPKVSPTPQETEQVSMSKKKGEPTEEEIKVESRDESALKLREEIRKVLDDLGKEKEKEPEN